MRRGRSLGLSALVCVACVAASGVATAQPQPAQPVRDPLAAEALFRDAREAFKRGDFATACPKFAESMRLDPAPGALFNLADCEERAGHLATAWLRWQELVDLLRPTPDDDRFDVAQQHVKDLAPRLPRLRIRWTGAPATDAEVKRDGVTLGEASFGAALPIDSGSHVVEVTAPGRAPRSYTVQTREGATTDLDIVAGEPPGEPAKVEGPSEKPKPPPSKGGSPFTALGWIGLGTGVVALGVGIGTGAAAFSSKATVDAECNADNLCSQTGVDAASTGHVLATTSTVTTVLGAVLTGTGVLFLVIGAATKKSPAARVVPLVGPTMGAAMEGRF